VIQVIIQTVGLIAIGIGIGSLTTWVMPLAASDPDSDPDSNSDMDYGIILYFLQVRD
jgi:hypothetical protein